MTSTLERGGATQVSARNGTISGLAVLTLQLRERHGDPEATDLPGTPGDSFGGAADPARDPQLVYPADGVLVPPNLGKLEIHFYPGTGNEIFEIGFHSATTDVAVYTRCLHPLNGGCIYQPDPTVWRWIAESNRGSLPMQVTVRGADDAGSGLGTSAPISVSFSEDDIQGGIYYWTTSATTGGETAIMRFDFGSDQTDPELFISTEMTGGNCVGCHALSRDGTKLVTASNGSYDGFVLLLDVGSRTPMVPYNSTPNSAFSSWNPDGTQFVGVFADETQAGWLSYDLNLFDGNTGASLGTIPVGGTEASPTDHPDWSPDGTRIAFSKVGVSGSTATGTLAFAKQCSLAYVESDGAGGWSAPVDLTTSAVGQSTYYPTFSPAGDLLAFNRSVCADGLNGDTCDSYDDPGATLYAMQPTAGATPVELAHANAPGVTDTATVVENSFPKWAPFTFQRTDEQGTRLHWITFSSDRHYGLRTPEAGHTLIWMAAINPDAALAGEDPSYAAFALPFQDLTTDNHTAQWTERVIEIE
jgi:hypothetical protein